jgi:SpoIID/LytB domain protein
MKIRIGLSANDLTTLNHSMLRLKSFGPLRVETENGTAVFKSGLPADIELSVKALAGRLIIGGYAPAEANQLSAVIVKPAKSESPFSITSLMRDQAGGRKPPVYSGELKLAATGNRLTACLLVEPDSYLRGVLGSEMPASYHLEAVKAQAVTARTYGLRPRIDHSAQDFDVCDSYLCCQNFVGNVEQINARYTAAIEATHNQVLTYHDKPILALFSSCAGGHTENYENCFSDLKTRQFPSEPIPYLQGVAEGSVPYDLADQTGLKQFWHLVKPNTCDAWSPHFKWKVTISADALESHMHHVVAQMLEDKEQSSFIKPPASRKFGQIEHFKIVRRGVSGTAVALAIHTSSGVWVVEKELVIRSVFKNPEAKLGRLKSARVFFEHQSDSLGLLSSLTVFGMGWGHGVGLQQTGAQGLAQAGQLYSQILSHYFAGTSLQQI